MVGRGTVPRCIILFTAVVMAASLLASCVAQWKAAPPDKVEWTVAASGAAGPSMQEAMGSAPGEAPRSEGELGGITERRVIKRAEITVDVEDAVETSAHIAARAEALGGYVSGSSVGRNREGRNEARVTVRVPADQFTALVEEIEKLGTLMSRQISSTDVTEEYVDLDARISNLKHQEKRLLEIVSQAKTVEDLLKVEKEIERVRGEIESLTGRLNLLKNQTDYATINVYLRSTPLAGAGISTSGMEGLWGRAVRALYNSLTVLIEGVGRAVVALFAALPYLALVALAGWAAWRLNRRRPLLRRASGQPAPRGDTPAA